MNSSQSDPDPIRSTSTLIRMSGLLLCILGMGGIFVPGVVSLVIEVFLGWLMVIGGLLWGYTSYQFRGRSFISWLKPLILIVGGSILLSNPASGIDAIALILSIYLFTDAFGSFGMAYERYPLAGWIWLLVNGTLSLALAVLILIGWPQASTIYLGIYVGISLLFDGLSLFILGLALKH